MPNFNVTTSQFRVRPVSQSELPPVQAMGRGPSLDYLTYANGPRQFNSRMAAGGAVAAAVSSVSAGLNEASLTVWLKNWLKANQVKISEQLLRNNHSVFVIQVNYAVANSFGNRMFLSRDIYLLGTVPTVKQIDTILTADVLYGPKLDAIPNNATQFQYAYLVGERL
jgi:hypothetical protein